MNDEANDPGLAGIFSTYPAPWLSVAGGLGDQVLDLFKYKPNQIPMNIC